jgi:hypothetical protein
MAWENADAIQYLFLRFSHRETLRWESRRVKNADDEEWRRRRTAGEQSVWLMAYSKGKELMAYS